MKHLALSLFVVLGLRSQADAAESVPLNQLKPVLNTASTDFGKTEFVYFWASWCPECREKFEKGTLNSLKSEFSKVSFITVNADRDEAKGKSYAESEKIALPVYRDDSKAITKSLRLFAVPGWAIIDRAEDGTYRVRKTSTGADLADIRQELARSM